MIMREQLKREAKGYDMCSEYFDRLDESKQNLISYYKQNPNECMEHRFPSIKLLEDYFNDEETRSMGVYVSQHMGDHICNKQIYIFNNCTGSINVLFNREEQIYPMIYLGHGSNMKINILNSRSPIYMFDSSKANITVLGNGHATLIRYNMNEFSCGENDINFNKIKVRDIDVKKMQNRY